MARRFFFSLGVIAESEDDKGIPWSILPVTDDFVFFYKVSKHCKWIMLSGTAFINYSSHINILKIIMRTVYFGIPTIKIFLNKNILWRRVGVIEILQNLHTSIWNFAIVEPVISNRE